MSKNCLSNPKLQEFSSLCLLNILQFNILNLDLRCILNYFCIKWSLGQNSFFFFLGTWLVNFAKTIVEVTILFPLNCLCLFVENDLANYTVWLCIWTLSVPLICACPLISTTLFWLLKLCKCWNHVELGLQLFQSCFGYSVLSILV